MPSPDAVAELRRLGNARFRREAEGQDLLEYALLFALMPRFGLWGPTLGLVVGLPVTYWGVLLNEASQWDPVFVELRGEQFNYWGSLAVSAAYVGLVMVFCLSGTGAWLKHTLGSVGQMAFTNYLMQSIICTTIFYGHGFGYFGHASRAEQLYVVIGVWVAQLIYSPLWLARFRYGPFEWLWRSLTYWKMQPILRGT